MTNSLFPVTSLELFCKRFSRWNYLLDGGAEKAAMRALQLLKDINRKVPPAVLAAWMHTALNGWCTARRFQSQGKCRLSQTCHGEDSLEHYSKCRFAWVCAQNRLRLSGAPRSFSRFLGLQGKSIEETTLLVVQQAAVYHAVNHVRTRNVRGSEGEAACLIEAKIRALGTQCRPLGNLLRDIWRRTT